eukprot:Hpha_TRINITY_DN16626_c4_g1::TRINITY_DN16626_c4_g1_i2::g.178315::m.178315
MFGQPYSTMPMMAMQQSMLQSMMMMPSSSIGFSQAALMPTSSSSANAPIVFARLADPTRLAQAMPVAVTAPAMSMVAPMAHALPVALPAAAEEAEKADPPPLVARLADAPLFFSPTSSTSTADGAPVYATESSGEWRERTEDNGTISEPISGEWGDDNDEGSNEDMPPLQDGVQVVVLTGITIDADLEALARRAGVHFDVPVVKWLAVWNKSALLVEFGLPVTVQSWVKDGTGLNIGPSPVPRIEVPVPSRTLNVRTFIMDPEHDFEGMPTDVAEHKKATQGWSGSKAHEAKEIRRLVEAAGGRASCFIVPRRPRMISPQEPRRCYTQLLFKYKNIESATHALEQIDGLRARVHGRRVTIRAEYSKPISE